VHTFGVENGLNLYISLWIFKELLGPDLLEFISLSLIKLFTANLGDVKSI
jgi:hypothetical protein